MAEPLQLHFDYGSLDSETLQYVWERRRTLRSLAWQTASGVVDIGQALTELAERLGHGQFLLWVRDEFAWGHDSATRFMNVYERFKNRNLRNLDLSALYLIAEQRTPDAVRDELIQRAESGEKITRRVALKAIKQFKEAGALPSGVSFGQTVAAPKNITRKPISPRTMKQPSWLTLEEAAVYSGLPAHYLERQIRDGLLTAIDVGIEPGVSYRVARRGLDTIGATPQAPTGHLSAAATAERRPIQRESRGRTSVRELAAATGGITRASEVLDTAPWRKRKPVSLVEVQQVIELPKDRQAGGAPNLHQSTADSEKQAVPEPKPKPIQRETGDRITPAQLELPFSIESNLVALDQKRQELSGSAMAPNTLSSYRHDWKTFNAWCAKVTRCALPASADTLSLFLTAQLTKGLKVASASRRLCAIIYYHQLAGIDLPGRFDAKQLLRSAQRQRAERPKRSRPLQIDELRQISDLLIKNGSAIAIRDRAVLLVGFASALRRSSIAALTLDDLEFTSEGVILTIVREKQDQEAKGRYVAIPHGKHENTCAVRALREWLAVRPQCQTREVFLRLTKGHEHSALYPELIAHVVKRGAVMIGLDPSVFSGHSLRSGLITAGGEAGLSDLLIAEQSGHRNMNVLRTYMRRPKAFRSNACAALDI